VRPVAEVPGDQRRDAIKGVIGGDTEQTTLHGRTAVGRGEHAPLQDVRRARGVRRRRRDGDGREVGGVVRRVQVDPAGAGPPVGEVVGGGPRLWNRQEF